MPGKRTQVDLLSETSKSHGIALPGPGASVSGTGGVGVLGPQAPGIDAVRTGQAVIKLGEHGHSVEQVQKHLKHIEVNGHFDKETQQAVKEFQQAHSLVADGIVGVHTIKLLIPATGGIEPQPSPGGVSPQD